MAYLRDTVFGLPRSPKHRLAWLVAAPLLILTIPARSGVSLDEAPSEAVAQSAPVIGAPVSGAVAVPAVTQAAVTASAKSLAPRRRAEFPIRQVCPPRACPGGKAPLGAGHPGVDVPLVSL